ncbi:hypothetical protein C0991_002580 [Blastosporella zonata]|nr:hypothetical protein C0991_002580 [Blastosporella zonata]
MSEIASSDTALRAIWVDNFTSLGGMRPRTSADTVGAIVGTLMGHLVTSINTTCSLTLTTTDTKVELLPPDGMSKDGAGKLVLVTRKQEKPPEPKCVRLYLSLANLLKQSRIDKTLIDSMVESKRVAEQERATREAAASQALDKAVSQALEKAVQKLMTEERKAREQAVEEAIGKERKAREEEFAKERKEREEGFAKDRKERQEEFEEKFAQERKEREKAQTKLQEAQDKLQKEQDKLQDAVQTSTELSIKLIPLQLRVLLDQSRQTILEIAQVETWADLRGDRRRPELVEYIMELLRSSNVANNLMRENIDYLCCYNNVRRDGNAAAHQATEAQIREAVATKPIGSQERTSLEHLFKFNFGYDV